MSDETNEKKGTGTPSSDDSTSNATADQRRSALRKILAGSGIAIGAKNLSEEWSVPVVNSVVLPAHAVSTLRDPCLLQVSAASGGFDVLVSGFVIPAVAGVNIAIVVQLLSGTTVVDTENTTAETVADGTYGPVAVFLAGAGDRVRAVASVEGVDQAVCEQPIAATTTSTTTSTPPPTTPPPTTTSFPTSMSTFPFQ